MTQTQKELLAALSAALFGDPASLPPLSEEAKQEALAQAVYPLVCDDKQAMQILTRNLRIAWEQQELTELLHSAQIPFIVLKGLSAAMFYPEPMKRTLGDIDLIVAPEDFANACAALLSGGFESADPMNGDRRHIHFQRNDVTVELHRRYAALSTLRADQILDRWICEAIPKAGEACAADSRFPVLPEPLNGLTLLAHISQHLEEGLGIRQLADWAVYVSRELTDEAWPAFRELTDQLELTKLACYTARFGQLYLGLPEEDHRWCLGADDTVCEALADHVFACGNFGTKAGKSNTVEMVLSHGHGFFAFFRNLQSRGERNWKAYQRHPCLRPLCWLYQAIRYARLGLRREDALAKLHTELSAGRERSELMRALGATRLADKR